MCDVPGSTGWCCREEGGAVATSREEARLVGLRVEPRPKGRGLTTSRVVFSGLSTRVERTGVTLREGVSMVAAAAAAATAAVAVAVAAARVAAVMASATFSGVATRSAAVAASEEAAATLAASAASVGGAPPS